MNRATAQAIVYRYRNDLTVTDMRALGGGMMAQAWALGVRDGDGGEDTLLLRWYSGRNSEWLALEYATLQHVTSAGLPAPTPLLFDDSRTLLPDGYLLLAYIEGEAAFTATDLDDTLPQCAAMLAAIHKTPLTATLADRLPDQTARCANWLRPAPDRPPDHSLNEPELRRVFASVWPPQQQNPPVLLHGDFWPGNLIWCAGKLVGVIDWENTYLGDPLSDVATTRLELAFAFGLPAAATFTNAYAQEMPGVDLHNLPIWDLCSAMRPLHAISAWAAGWPALGRPDVTADTMRAAHSDFVAQAVARL